MIYKLYKIYFCLPINKSKPYEVIVLLSNNTGSKKFIDEGAKALVIACNTATAAAADELAQHPQ